MTRHSRIVATRRRNKVRPQFDVLESRATPALMTVSNAVVDGAPGSLRAAIIAANALPGLDTITFAPATFNVPTTIGLLIGQLPVTDSVIIDATSVPPVTINGNNAGFNVFGIDDGMPGTVTNVTLRGLTVTGGNGVMFGAGIYVAEEVVTVEGCTVTANTAGNYGGGIYVKSLGQLTVRQSTISNNVANTAGGGVYANINSGLLIDRSTVRGNLAVFGGGSAFWGSPGAAGWTIRNSTLSGNSMLPGGLGGAIVTNFFGGLMRIENSTITQNQSTGAGGIQELNLANGVFDIRSSIVSGNFGNPVEIAAQNVQAQTSWLTTNAGITNWTDLGGNLPFGLPVLATPLANNGGPTLTHALPAGHPAINAGSNPAGLTTDQRSGGYVRGFPGPGAVDIGAYEVQVSPPRVIAVTINGGAAQRSMVTSVDVTFDQAVGLPTPPEAAFQLQRIGDGANVNLAGVVSGGGTNVTLTFTGGAVDFNSLADGRYVLKVLASQIVGNWFDGNSDGTSGDDYLLTSYGTSGVFRLFGDADGDADVDTSDFAAFRLAYGGASTTFDFDNDGDVDTTDYAQFRQRFGASI